ncbi:MAG TPA: peptidylprolyl isomerase [Candidatus Acidoferrales bacterium]|nr:peptidylprolyl isomerase [Candidatus Acidoferrales bacterium]
MNIAKFTAAKLTTLLLSTVLITAFGAPSLFGQTRRTTPRRKTVSTTGSLLNPASLHATAPATYDVKFHTTKGDFTVQVTRAWAPNGADRFYNLVEHHFYDDATLFRVVAGFVVQFGIPADPRYGKIWANANIKDDPVKESNLRGYITYAQSSAPNSRSTQVFVNFRDNSRLDSMGFAPFGKVTEGMNVVESFYGGYADQPTGMQDQIANQGNAFLEKNFPKLDKILTARIVPATPAHPATH